ncbi:molybdopterin-binding protein [Kitasatospora sp. NPDC058965]|uniref:TOBE domain-containing protein n=1 Tax=Kitasatospora sp. NPDC058965 TaxID=3346682 RepID=UPI0036AD3C0E
MSALSIRNQLPGTVTEITDGAVMATVKVRLSGGQEVTAAITLDAVKDLGLAAGSPVQALAKSTEIALATAPVSGLSIRNQLPGTVASVATGGAMATVKLTIDGGGDLTAAVTAEAVTELGLATGSPVVALIKSTELALSAG